jgi:hypothetical protein
VIGLEALRGVQSSSWRTTIFQRLQKAGLLPTHFLARQLRLEYEGTLYHITSRSNSQAAIYLDDKD